MVSKREETSEAGAKKSYFYDKSVSGINSLRAVEKRGILFKNDTFTAIRDIF